MNGEKRHPSYWCFVSSPFFNTVCLYIWLPVTCSASSCRVISPVDGKSMESICSTKMFQKSEYKENGKIIRWTEVGDELTGDKLLIIATDVHMKLCPFVWMFVQVFFLQRGDHPTEGVSDSAERNRLTERIARAFCLALCPHLKLLKEDGMAKLGLRVTFESHEVRENV